MHDYMFDFARIKVIISNLKSGNFWMAPILQMIISDLRFKTELKMHNLSIHVPIFKCPIT